MKTTSTSKTSTHLVKCLALELWSWRYKAKFGAMLMAKVEVESEGLRYEATRSPGTHCFKS
jgi:hypothetical protein